jgi:hypothetical protein
MDPTRRQPQSESTTNKLTTRCIESINRDNAVRNLFKEGHSVTQRAILSAWYDGYRAANPEQQIISQERFLEESLPEVVEAVAA